MLTLLTYVSNHDLQTRLATKLAGHATKFVTPNPAKADALRQHWADRSQTDVVTLTRFTKDLFALLKDRPSAPWRKSRLLLQLNRFRHLVPALSELDFGTFKTAYQAFSDLRAYTDAPEFPEELLAHFDERVALMAQLFHQGCARAGILDEHAGVFELTARLRAMDGLQLPNVAAIVFDGFTFLTPAQLSFIEALAIRHEVIVPLPQKVFENSHALDWPRALELSAHEVLPSDVAQPTLQPLQVWNYPTGMMAEALKDWREKNPGDVQLVLGAKNPTELHLQEIPFSDLFQKTPVDITHEAREVVFSRWEKRISQAKSRLPASALLDWITQDKQTIVQEKKLSLMRELSVLHLVEKAIEEVPGCLDQQPLNGFFLSLLSEVIALDAPRSSMIPLLSEKPRIQLYNLKNFQGLRSELPTLLCLDGIFGTVKSDHRPFSPEMEKMLAKLGPVRRPELEFLFLQAELVELWPHKKLTIVMEQGLVKHDLGWKRLFESLPLETKQLEFKLPLHTNDYQFFMPQPGVVPAPERLSASRLQDFLDCPRKYHADRVEKLIPRVESTLELEPMALGTIEHNLVEEGWEKGAEYWARPGQLERDALRMVNERDELKRLTPALKMAAVSEAVLCARNGLERLTQLSRALPGISFQFEVEVTAPGRTGYIDCLGTVNDILILLDFKRSKGSNPSLGAWEEDYPKIQLWFYLNALREQGLLKSETRVGVGYLFFKDLDKSWMACHSSLEPAIAAQVEGWANGRDDLMGALERYNNFEMLQRERLITESVFAPSPRDSKVCDNCGLRALCPKGDGEEDE